MLSGTNIIVLQVHSGGGQVKFVIPDFLLAFYSIFFLLSTISTMFDEPVRIFYKIGFPLQGSFAR